MAPTASAAFARFAAEHCGLALEPFQREIIDGVLTHRETLVLLPRGNGKTTLSAALAIYALLGTPGAAVYLAAASRDQARILLEAAQRMVHASPALSSRVTVRHRELRANGGTLRTLSSDGPRAHGLMPRPLVIVDELHAHRDPALYVALRTALGKGQGSRMLVLTTAGYEPASVLGKLRTAALALPHVERDGCHTIAHDGNGGFLMHEWACGDQDDLADPAVVKRANPASFVRENWLAEQIASPGLHPLEFARYHANVWTTGATSWLPQGAWQACEGDATIDPGEAVWAGVDVGGERSATALVWVTADLRVGCRTWQGDRAVLEVAPALRDLAHDHDLRGVYYDPWRFQAPALELQADGLPMVEYGQSHANMVPASEALHAAIVEGNVTHDGDPELTRHVLSAAARSTGRGWRLDKATRSSQIDAAIALAMAVRAAQAPVETAEPMRVLGWL
ncbi:MAG: terminase large subunit [Solirubrobacteraceae bacterium]